MTGTTSAPLLVHDVDGLSRALAVRNPPGSAPYGRAVVMTMGALHAGHLSLVRAAKQLAATVVVTVFVNPLQFGPTEDLERYPRDLDADLRLLSGPGLLGPDDVVFAPTPEVMYPDGEPAVRVSAGPIGTVLEGAVRPGHFDGVLTVVLKLMHLTGPDVALFGRKDAQQLAAVRAMVRDLDVPVEVRGVPIVRDDDGLALSSRNAYLSPADRRRALALSRALAAGRDCAADGGTPSQVREATRAVLSNSVDAVDYVALVHPDTFAELTGTEPTRTEPTRTGLADTEPTDTEPTRTGLTGGATGTALLAVAARVGGTRLIDNTDVELIGLT